LSESARKAVIQTYTEQGHDLRRKAARNGKDSAATHNVLAWFLATSPNPVVRNPVLAVELAPEATRRAPEAAAPWNTLGVAHYRAGAWKEARAAWEKSMQLGKGGSGGDWLFLAMTVWQQGDKESARTWYEKAVRWMDEHDPKTRSCADSARRRRIYYASKTTRRQRPLRADERLARSASDGPICPSLALRASRQKVSGWV
jgi:tetratricopeptide (TPR) repeat protein